MRRKQSMQHFDQRQLLLLENAYYQVCYATSHFHSIMTFALARFSAIHLKERPGKKSSVPLWNYSSGI